MFAGVPRHADCTEALLKGEQGCGRGKKGAGAGARKKPIHDVSAGGSARAEFYLALHG